MNDKITTLRNEVLEANKRGANLYFDLSIHPCGMHYVRAYTSDVGIDDPWCICNTTCYFKDGVFLSHGKNIDDLIREVKSL